MNVLAEALFRNVQIWCIRYRRLRMDAVQNILRWKIANACEQRPRETQDIFERLAKMLHEVLSLVKWGGQ